LYFTYPDFFDKHAKQKPITIILENVDEDFLWKLIYDKKFREEFARRVEEKAKMKRSAM